MAYITRSQVEDYLGVDISTDLDARLDTWISYAQKWIDNYTDRTFESARSVKKFDGAGRHYLYIDDILSVSTIWMVANDATSDSGSKALSSSDFYLYQDSNPNKTPYNRIVLNPNGGYSSFDWGYQNVWIDGAWGYSETAPEDIQMTAVKLVGGVINVGKNEGIKTFSEGDFSVTYSDFDRLSSMDVSIKEVLGYYKKKSPLITGKMLRI